MKYVQELANHIKGILVFSQEQNVIALLLRDENGIVHEIGPVDPSHIEKLQLILNNPVWKIFADSEI